jgi:hypothetical protein
VGTKKKSFANCLDIIPHQFGPESSVIAVALTIQGEILIVDTDSLTTQPKGNTFFK